MNVNHPNSAYLDSAYPNPLYPGSGLPPRVNFGWISEALAFYKTNLGLWLSATLLGSFAMVADGVSLGDALRRCVQAMSRDEVSAAGFAFVLGLLVLASALLFGLGLLVTLPLCWLLSALAYRDMVGFPVPSLADDLPNGLPHNAEITLSAGEPRFSLKGELLDSDGNIVSERAIQKSTSEPEAVE